MSLWLFRASVILSLLLSSILFYYSFFNKSWSIWNSELMNHNKNKAFLSVLCYPSHFQFLVSTVVIHILVTTVQYNFSFSYVFIVFHLYVFFFTSWQNKTAFYFCPSFVLCVIYILANCKEIYSEKELNSTQSVIVYLFFVAFLLV